MILIFDKQKLSPYPKKSDMLPSKYKIFFLSHLRGRRRKRYRRKGGTMFVYVYCLLNIVYIEKHFLIQILLFL